MSNYASNLPILYYSDPSICFGTGMPDILQNSFYLHASTLQRPSSNSHFLSCGQFVDKPTVVVGMYLLQVYTSFNLFRFHYQPYLQLGRLSEDERLAVRSGRLLRFVDKQSVPVNRIPTRSLCRGTGQL
jgi:hypothetical protein